MMVTFNLFSILLGLGALLTFNTKNCVKASIELNNLSCAPNETECFSGCCPYTEAVCCDFGCCRHGQICFFGICLWLEAKTGQDPVLMSSAATPLRNVNVPCPNGTTTCDFGRCCIYPDATCCEDGLHCCPHGYRCDLPNRQCVRNSYNYLDSYTLGSAIAKILMQKDDGKICPGSSKKCPSYSTCCMNYRGNWGCCPNPSPSKENDCCSTVYGFVCCPAVAPHCTLWGCRP